MFRTAVLPIDEYARDHQAATAELERLGNEPVVAEFICGTAVIQVAASAEHVRYSPHRGQPNPPQTRRHFQADPTR